MHWTSVLSQSWLLQTPLSALHVSTLFRVTVFLLRVLLVIMHTTLRLAPAPRKELLDQWGAANETNGSAALAEIETAD